MYTRAELEKKTLFELKAIAVELGAEPSGDRRLKETWVKAIIVGVATPWEPSQPKAIAVLEEVVKTCSGQYTMYTRAELQNKTLKELKAIVTELKLTEPRKDKRAKTTWIELILWNINYWEDFIKEMLKRFPEKWARSVCQSFFEEKPRQGFSGSPLASGVSG